MNPVLTTTEYHQIFGECAVLVANCDRLAKEQRDGLVKAGYSPAQIEFLMEDPFAFVLPEGR